MEFTPIVTPELYLAIMGVFAATMLVRAWLAGLNRPRRVPVIIRNRRPRG